MTQREEKRIERCIREEAETVVKKGEARASKLKSWVRAWSSTLTFVALGLGGLSGFLISNERAQVRNEQTDERSHQNEIAIQATQTLDSLQSMDIKENEKNIESLTKEIERNGRMTEEIFKVIVGADKLKRLDK